VNADFARSVSPPFTVAGLPARGHHDDHGGKRDDDHSGPGRGDDDDGHGGHGRG
jgi:hypothetical protein